MMSAETCKNVLDWRYATKEFDASKKIDSETWDALLKSLWCAPSSFGMELWQFIDVQSPEIRQKLRAVSWDQSQVTDASHYVVFCVRREVLESDCDRHIGRICEVRGMSADMLAAYKKKFTEYYEAKTEHEPVSWIDRQSYIALGFVMFAAAAMGVDTCPIEGMEPEKYNEILGLADSPYHAICGLALGYRDSNDRYASFPKVRYRREDVIKTV